MSMHVGGKCRKWMDGRTARQTQSYGVMTLELDLLYIKQRHM